MKPISVTEIQCAKLGLADARCALQNGLKDLLQVAWGTGDDPQHLRGGCLLRSRLIEFALVCFELTFWMGAWFAYLTNALSRLRSGRTTFMPRIRHSGVEKIARKPKCV